RPDTVRLLWTGYQEFEDAVRAINEGGVFRYINKVCRVEELLAMLSEAAEYYDEQTKRKRRLVELEAHAPGGTAVHQPRPAYQGRAPFLFVSYAHENREQVYPEIG